MLKQCVLSKKFTFKKKHLFWRILDQFRACFGLNQTISSRIEEKKKDHKWACSQVHGRTTHPCISNSGAPTQSAHHAFQLWKPKSIVVLVKNPRQSSSETCLECFRFSLHCSLKEAHFVMKLLASEKS
ncbi:hypothetical protein ACJW30_10G053600 [Castanea mollissima]